jgi:hypothetical protein
MATNSTWSVCMHHAVIAQNVPNVFSEYAVRLEEEGWYIELDGWQDIFHLEASYHASAPTLTVAVRIPLLRRES